MTITLIFSKEYLTPVPFTSRYTLHRNHKGQIIRLLGLSVDTTDHKKIESELVAHREHLQKLVEERAEELAGKITEFEEMNHVFVGREFRGKELKDKIDELTLRVKT